MNIIMIVSLFIISALAYLVIMRILDTKWNAKKRKRLSIYLKEQEEVVQNNRLFNWLEKKGVLRYISPSYNISKSKEYGVRVSKQSYFSTFLLGTVIGIVIMFVYFRPVIFLLPIALLGGVIATNVKLHNAKKEYFHLLDSKISIYMSSVATAMLTFSNLKDTLNSVMPSLEQPIKNDVQRAMLLLQDGKDPKAAFEEMNKKYQQKELRLFHDQLDVLVKSGAEDRETLRVIAFKMKKKETYKRKLKTAHKQQMKIWRTFVFLSLSVPFLFIFASMDNYKLVMNHIASSVVFAITFLLIFVTYRKLEELEVYDPTTDESLDL